MEKKKVFNMFRAETAEQQAGQEVPNPCFGPREGASSRPDKAPSKMTDETKLILTKGGWSLKIDKLEILGFKSMADLKTLEEKDYKRVNLSQKEMNNFVLFLQKPSVMSFEGWFGV